MKRFDIDKIFTRMMGEYLEKGYVIHTSTMSGHQGEVAKVDLYKGDDIIRMNLAKMNDWHKDTDGYVLTVGRATKWFNSGDGSIIWTKECEDIERHSFWRIGKDWFTGFEDYAEKCSNLRRNRWKDDWSNVDPLTESRRDLPDSCRKVVLGRIRKMDGCHSVKLSDIKKVRKIRYDDGSAIYVADVRNKSVTVGTVNCA